MINVCVVFDNQDFSHGLSPLSFSTICAAAVNMKCLQGLLRVNMVCLQGLLRVNIKTTEASSAARDNLF